MRTFKRSLPFLVAAGLLVPGAALADVTFEFNGTFSNSTVPAGSPPWLTALFHDVDATHVQLTLTNQLQGSTEFLSDVFFNVLGGTPGITITANAGDTGAVKQIQPPPSPPCPTGENCYKADGDGYYDIEIDFKTGHSDDRFVAGETVGFLLTRGSGLTAADFLDQSVPGGGEGTYYAAGHVQSISTGTGSTFISGAPVTVPEASFLLQFGMLLTGAVWLLRKRRTS